MTLKIQKILVGCPTAIPTQKHHAEKYKSVTPTTRIASKHKMSFNCSYLQYLVYTPGMIVHCLPLPPFPLSSFLLLDRTARCPVHVHIHTCTLAPLNRIAAPSPCLPNCKRNPTKLADSCGKLQTRAAINTTQRGRRGAIISAKPNTAKIKNKTAKKSLNHLPRPNVVLFERSKVQPF